MKKNFENLDKRMHIIYVHTHFHTQQIIVESYKQTNRCKREKAKNKREKEIYI